MAKKPELSTNAAPTWCPGCYNFFILKAVQNVLEKMIKQGKLKQENIVMATGIGCHAKIFDYLNVGGVYSLHGRTIAAALGMKLGNPNLTVFGFGGDGDTYDEGVSHFVHNCRYNADINMIVHNNQIFALTTGQGTATSEEYAVTKAQPEGLKIKPMNPIAVALELGATFVARAFAGDMEHMTKIIEEAVKHKGFSLIDILQPCLIFHNKLESMNKQFYKLEDKKHDFKNLDLALKKAREWDYEDEKSGIPLGIFYKVREPTLNEKLSNQKKLMEKGKGWFQVKR
ncbi:2-oxoacid:ferredoxin oxidoreductase subunit beta [Candidatus Woesearchaeota archaeon]|nr:2-oxoacid:ferredoxin oxidoreductase subunit beta [Candidatus Woesearchaeota archaeon]